MAELPRPDFGPNGERRIARARAEKLSPEERAARNALSRQRWREANPDYGRLWKQANPEKHRAYSRATAHRKQRRLRRNENARAKYREDPEPHRERGRRFRLEHPEKVAEYQRRYRDKHPDRVADQSRRATQKWRDTNALTAREKDRSAAASRREANPDQFRDWYNANLERERARSRDASRLRSRLKALGLPPRKMTKVYAADKRANTAAADKFFERRRSAADVAAARRPSMPHDAALRAGAKERFEPTPPHLLAAWARDSALARARLTVDQRRDLFAGYLVKHGAQLREEIRMDSRARVLRGAPPLDAERELRSRASAALNEAENARLTRIVNRAMTSFGVPPSAAVTRADTKATRPTTALPRAERSDLER